MALSLVAGCGGTAGDTTTTTAATTTTVVATTTTTTIPEIPVFPDDAEPIPLDESVRYGTLANGLAYYIRENDAPGGRAQLRLAVRAGSVNQTADQPGVAHFLEHMMFNGTEAYPANELVAVLQRFGAEFGPDINAYTSYEETVYMLELPTDDPDTVATGFEVLREWAAAATLDPVEVDLERGVLVEEWRVRDQGFWGRYFAAVTDVLLAGSPYEDRLPLADPDEVAGTTPESLAAFYRDWYRPDLMAVIAVGDFDATTIEGMIEDEFGSLTTSAGSPAVPELLTAPFADPVALILADPEAPDAFVEINYPSPIPLASATVGSVRRHLAMEAALEMLTTRLYEDTLRGVTPYFDPSRAANDFVRTHATGGIAASANPADLAETTAALLTEVERARRHGFTPSELERITAELRSAVESEFEQNATKQDGAFAFDYVEHYLGGAPAGEAEAWRDLQLRLIDELTLEQVHATFATTVSSTHPLVIVAGPEAFASEIPTTAEVEAIVAEVAAGELEPRPDTPPALGPLMEAPDPSGVDGRYTLSDTGIPVIELPNGLWFIPWPTEIHAGHVELVAASPGGWVRVADADVAEAKLLDEVMLASGVGEFDQVELEQILVGSEVALTPYIEEVWEGFAGGADTGDLEILFQLAHLYMSEPRFDPVAIPIVQNRLQQQVESPETLVDLAFALALADARFPGDDRFSPLPSSAELDRLDLERVEAVFEDRFGDPGDFVFVLVGEFDIDEAEMLARRYLGSIPGGNFREGVLDDRPDRPEGVVVETVEAGTGERGVFALQFEVDVVLDFDLRVHLDILEAVLEQRLINHIREELSASYSPRVTVAQVHEPVAAIEVMVRIDGDPAGIDAVRLAVLEDLADLVASGPTADEFAIAQEQVLRNYELIDNLQLAAAALHAVFYPEDPLSEIITRFDRAVAATAADIRAAAVLAIDLEDYIEIRLVPIGFAD